MEDKMRCKIFITLFIIILTFYSHADWVKTYGGISGDDYAYSVIQTYDNGYLITGSESSSGASPFNDNVYLIRTDSRGETLWTRSYGEHNTDIGCDAVQTSDSGFAVVGFTGVPLSSYKVLLIRTDALGETLWTHTYGGVYIDFGYDIAQTLDNGFIIVGQTTSFGAGDYDVYLIKTDSLGDTMWTRTYGGLEPDGATSICVTPDGDFIIAGHTSSFGAGDYDVYLLKIDSFGDTIWTRTYGGSSMDVGQSVQQTLDDGYIIAGYSCSFDSVDTNVYLIKTDSLGDTFWTRTYGGIHREKARSVVQTIDNRYVLVGMTKSFGLGPRDLYVIKTDEWGETLWTRTYGGNGWDEGYSVIQSSFDCGYIITGYTTISESRYVYLIKIGSNGIVEQETQKIENISLTVYPNPFNSYCRISAPADATIEIVNLRGESIEASLTKSSYAETNNESFSYIWQPDKSINSGVYLVRMITENRIITKRIVYLK